MSVDKKSISRRRVLRGGVAVTVGAAATSILAACTPSAAAPAVSVPNPVATISDASTPKRGGVLIAAFSADPAGFDPVQGPSGMSHVVIEQVYSTLMALDPDAQPYPELAESYELSPDGLNYTFKLRKGIKFHNGDPFTADDVKFTFDRLRAKDSGYSYTSQVETISSIEVIDPQTVQFKLKQTTGPFLIYMAFPGSSIVPKKLIESGHDLNAKPIGTGPFKFVSYEPRSAIKFVRNDDYFQLGLPYFDAMEYKIISDVTALTNALQSGVVNFSNEIPPKDFAAVSTNSELVGLTLEGSRFNWLMCNNSKKPFDNAKVRQAVSMVLDRQALTDGAFFGYATPILGGVIPKWNWGYADDVKFVGPKGDASAAKKLLADAGFPDGFETSITIASSFPAQMAMAPIIQANLESIGIKAKIGGVEIPRYWDEVWATSNFDITTMYWLSPLADPDDFVFNNYACSSSTNVQKSCSKELDDLLSKAKGATSQDERKKLYHDLQELTMKEMPIVPLVNGWLLIAHTKKLANYKPMRTGFLKTLKDAWFV